MRYLKVLVIVFALMALAPQTAFGNSTSFKYGEIIEVFPEQHKVRVVIGGQMDILFWTAAPRFTETVSRLRLFLLDLLPKAAFKTDCSF